MLILTQLHDADPNIAEWCWY